MAGDYSNDELKETANSDRRQRPVETDDLLAPRPGAPYMLPRSNSREPAIAVDDDDVEVLFHVAGDPAFTDELDTDSVVPAPAVDDDDIDDGSASSARVHWGRLAIVVLGLCPALAYGFVVYGLPMARDSDAPPSMSRATLYPEAPFRATTDQPMSAGEIKAWLKAKPRPDRTERLSALARPSAGADPADTPPPPGHLYVPKAGKAIALHPQATPTRPAPPRPASTPRRAPSTGPGVQTAASPGGAAPPWLRLGGLVQTSSPGDTFVYEATPIKNTDVFVPKAETAHEAARAQPIQLTVGDAFAVKLHSGLSSVSSDTVVLAKVTQHVRKAGQLVIPQGAILRGTIQTYGERRFFLRFGEFSVSGVRYGFVGRAEERNYAGIVAVRREATLKERQRSTLINGVLSGLVGASAVAAQGLPPGLQEASQVIASGTRENTLREERVREGFVLEAAKGKRFRILVTE